jgi:surfeit locus 1 family protein
MSRWRFRPGWIPSVAAIAFVALAITAGNWQMRRAVEKEDRADTSAARAKEPPATVGPAPVEGAELVWRNVQVQGEYMADKAILLDNRVLRGRVGYEVLTPLRIADADARLSSTYVVVDRGWVPAGATRAALPQVPTPAGVQRVEGLATVPPLRVFELGESPPTGRVWQHFLLDRYRAWSALQLQPIVILQTNEAADGLIRDWTPPEAGSVKHRSYALQWYSFAILTVILYVVLNLKRTPRI